jgi:uncharacterized protein (DUF362 family)
MVKICFPVLTILDMIYIAPSGGPNSSYNVAVQKNMIAAGTDLVALDYRASKNVLMPAAQASGNRRSSSIDPDGKEPGSFGIGSAWPWRNCIKAALAPPWTKKTSGYKKLIKRQCP